jgi:hypothetical protein
MHMYNLQVLALSRRQHHHYAPLLAHFPIIEIDDWSLDEVVKHNPDILITLSGDWYEAYACIQVAKEKQIPTLLIMDGIIEWRHEWEDPVYGAGGGIAYYQPVVTDKIACLGWQTARILEGWGNIGKCEIVGAARFDSYLNDPIPPPTHEGPKRLLIMTANTPGFTPLQIDLVEQSLLDVKDYLSQQDDWKPIWRVRKGLDQKLGLTDEFPHLRTQSLRDALASADAVLTTPSTTLLEAMLSGRPTAILDYSNSPPYVNAAWMITACKHISVVLEKMKTPEQSRMVYQDEILHNNLECYTPALPRLAMLIKEMAEIGRKARENGNELQFPDRIVPIEFGGHAVMSKNFDLAKLYPNHPVYTNHDLVALQTALTHTNTEISELKRQLKKLKQRSILSTLARRILRRY